MKKNLFTAFLAVALVMALVFVVAPGTKAETAVDFKFDAENTTYTVAGDCVIDLNGIDATITIADGVENPNVVVIDSANLDDMTGASTGTLTVDGDCTINDVNLVNNYRYLKVPNNDGTYSFYPFNMAITMAGVHVKGNAVSLEVKFVANKVVQDKLTAYGLYKHDGDNAGRYTNVKDQDNGGHVFEDGKYGLRVCFDLTGSLTTDMLNETRIFSAYVEIDGTPIIGNQRVAVTPADILDLVNEGYEASSDEQKTLAKVLFWKNPDLRAELGNITDAVNTVTKYQKITSLDELTSGNYVIVINGRAMGVDGTYTADRSQPTTNAVVPTIEDGIVTDTLGAVCELTVENGKVSIKTPDGSAYLAPVNGTYAGSEYLATRALDKSVFWWTVDDNEDDTFYFRYKSLGDSKEYRLTYATFFRTRPVDDAKVAEFPPAIELYKEVTSELLNCTEHIDKNGAEGGYVCDFCEQTFVPIPDPRSYDYLNNFAGKTLNSSGAATAELDEIISLSTNYASVSANQKCINYSFGINSKAYIGFKSTYDLSEVSLTVGGRNSNGTENPGRSYSCTVVFLDEEGNTLKEESVDTFVSTTTVTFSDLPDGCREVRVSAVTVTGNSWFGLYNFSCTFTD